LIESPRSLQLSRKDPPHGDSRWGGDFHGDSFAGKERVMSESQTNRARLRAIFNQYVPASAELDAIFNGAPLLETVSIDSITLIHLIVAIEKEFAVRFDETSMDQAFSNIDSLLKFIGRPQGGSEG
jgi:acyl carrier protein